MQRLRRAAAIAAASLAVLILTPAAAGAQRPQLDYVALGDSYSSGAGAGSYIDNACYRSLNAHPALLAAAVDAALTFVACGRVRTEDVLDEQVQALDAATDLVTIGIGCNDIGWSSVVAACITPLLDCFPVIEEAERKVTGELPAKLDAVYTAIEERSPDAEVYLTGYPRLFAARNTCDALSSISIAEQERMNVGADLLSAVIEEAATSHGFTYADVREDFTAHEICSREPWMHGFTLLNVPLSPQCLGS